MGFSEALQWWGEWQLRVLVLGSLVLQFFLFCAATLRKQFVPSYFRFLTWLAYLGSDGLAIYALAALFNHHKSHGWMFTHSSSIGLEALWAPILLLHLAGRDGITAYSIEDNELWKRHILTAVSQIAITTYIIYKSWPEDKKLLIATMLVFVPGTLKLLEKPYAFKKASINGMAKALSQPKHKRGDAIRRKAVGINSLEEYVQAASNYVRNGCAEDEPSDHKGTRNPYKLFVDLPYSYSIQFWHLQYLMKKENPIDVQDLLCSQLSKTFDRLYTKSEVRQVCGQKVPALVVLSTFLAIGLFHMCHREAYNRTDVMFTYTLLCGTAVLELVSLYIGSYFFGCFQQIGQYNLEEHVFRKRRWRMVYKLASLLGCKGLLNRFWSMKPCRYPTGITELVYHHIISGWSDINNATQYREFNDNRGQRTLKQHAHGDLLNWSLQKPFDESVLLWHLATDSCFFSSNSTASEEAHRCKVMSNYMAHLLFSNPEMLMPGARPNLFKAAYIELMESRSDSGFVHDGRRLSQELMSLAVDDMWSLIQGVWVEMLCFSAGRSRGYLHAKGLGNGGEYLSHVWMLLSYMGMQTFTDTLRRTSLPEKGDMGADVLNTLVDTADQLITVAVAATGDENADGQTVDGALEIQSVD